MWKGILVAVVQWGQKFVRILLDLLYPPVCVGCGQVGTTYCRSCRDAVLFVAPPLCPLCGRPQETSKLCSRCAHHPFELDGIRSVAFFEGALRKAIHRFKYNYARELAIPLGDMLVHFWRQAPLEADLIVPVPLHARRLRERGYNQSALLAGYLGQAVGIPVAGDVLYRNRYTRSQAQLNAAERSQNVEGAFSCNGSGVQGRHVLLVDDVCTTGSTLDACSVALKEGGAVSVWALTLARADSTDHHHT
jgi:ComF family protein